MSKFINPSLLALSTALVAFPCAALAQSQPAAIDPRAGEQSATSLDEIVVTAQRRSERLQDVPISVSAITQEQLGQSGVTAVTDLRIAVPTLNLTTSAGSLSTSLRGVGSNAFGPGQENPVALYVDGVYYGSTTGSVFSLNSISQIEVLKGPQGTLFGRNATGGLIQIRTREPGQALSGQATVGYASFGVVSAGAYLGGGLTDRLRADVALQYSHQDEGWGTNLANGKDVYRVDRDLTLRSKVIFEPTDTAKFTLIGDYSDITNSMSGNVVVPGTISGFNPAAGPAPSMGWDVTNDVQPNQRAQTGGLSLRWDQQIGDLDFMSLTAYRRTKFHSLFDYDASALPLGVIDSTTDEDQFSQEFQLSSPNTGPLTWLVGAYYYRANAAFEPVHVTPGAGVVITVNSTQETEALAGFAQATYEVLPDTHLTLGGRYSSETRKLVDGTTDVFVIPLGFSLPLIVAPDREAEFNSFTYRISLDHRFSENVLAFASYNRGFKSGGFNTSGPGSDPFQPETLDAAEVGLKTDLLDRRVRANLGAFHYDYSNIQVLRLDQGALSVINGAGAELYGLDLDVTFAATDKLLLVGGLGLVHSEFTDFPNCPISTAMGGTPTVFGSCKGNSLPLAAKVLASLSASYTVPLSAGDLVLAANAYYNDGYSQESDNKVQQEAFTQLGASATYTLSSGLTFSAFGKNLTNERVLSFETTVPNGTHSAFWGAPRTYGVSVGYKF